MLRICFVCLPAAPVIEPSIGGGIGGTETRAWLLARTLARIPETAVELIVRHRRRLPRDEYEGVRVRTLVDRLYHYEEQVALSVSRTRSFPYLRFKKRPDLTTLAQMVGVIALRSTGFRNSDFQSPHLFYTRLEGDVFATFGVQSNSARVIASAQTAGRPSVLMLGSDGDLDERYVTDPDYVTPYGDRSTVCREIIATATQIVCQSESQRELLKSRFDREGIVVPNPIDLAAWDATAAVPCALPVEARDFVLWVGRAEGVHKRPMQCIEIAKLCPDVPFVMVMNRREAEEERRVREAAPPNVTILENVPPAQMPRLMERSLLLLNTSSLEGFPNTFLQAAASRRPVVSLVVQPEYLAESGMGVCAGGDVRRGAESVEQIRTERSWAAEMGELGRRWVESHHDAMVIARQLREFFARAANAKRA